MPLNKVQIFSYGANLSLRSFLMLLLLVMSLMMAAVKVKAETVDPFRPGAPGSVVKELDPKLYSLYRPYVQKELDISCDTCFGPKVTEQLKQLRVTLRSQADVDYVASILARELQTGNPDWDFVFVALKAAEFGMTNDPRIQVFCRQILAALGTMPDAAMDAASQAVKDLAGSGEKDDRSFLVSLLSESMLTSPVEGFTKKREMLGVIIAISVVTRFPPQDAITALSNVVASIEHKESRSPFDKHSRYCETQPREVIQAMMRGNSGNRGQPPISGLPSVATQAT